MCGGSNLSTFLVVWGIYINKCISLVRIRTDPKFAKCIYKILKNFRVEKNGEISRNLSFSVLHRVAGLFFRSRIFSDLTMPGIRLQRRFARPAPGERALRSSDGECEPTHLLCKCSANLCIPANTKSTRMGALCVVMCVRFRCKAVCIQF